MSGIAEIPPSNVADPLVMNDTLAGPRRPISRRAVIAWAIVGCALMTTSGIVRAIQERRFAVEKGYLEDCPFPLTSLPKELDGWRVIDGQDKTLDAPTARITGATEHVMRTYVDELTGVTLSVLILFGPAEPVLPHTPQICYPACGFTPTEEASQRIVKGPNNQSYTFRSGVYAKSGGRALVREVAYHSFRLEGPWSPDIATGRKFPRKNPGIFKVQIQRRVAEGELREHDDPIEQFLSRLIPEIDRRIAESQAAKAATPGPTTAGTSRGPTSSRAGG